MKNIAKWLCNNFLIFSFLFLIFQSPLSRIPQLQGTISNLIGGYEELFSFAAAGLWFLAIFDKGITRKTVYPMLLFLAFMLIGMIGTVIYHIQPMGAVFEDIVNCSKFMLTLLGIYSVRHLYDGKRIIYILQRISYFLIAVFTLMAVVDEILPNRIFPALFWRYGVHCITLFYYHPAVLCQVTVLLLAIISFDNNDKYCPVFKVCCMLLLIATFRSKALGYVFFYIILWSYQRLRIGYYKYILVILGIVGMVFVSAGNIETYYMNSDTARMLLTTDSLRIMMKYFPIGIGFATFGSASAVKYYSPVYVKLGYIHRWMMGLGGTTNFLTDSFWPVIFAEFGAIGTIVFLAMIGDVCWKCYTVSTKNRNAGIAVLGLMAYFLICSTASTAFFNPIAVPNAIIMGIAFSLYL